MGNTSYAEIVELVLSILKSFELDKIFDKYDETGLITFFQPYFKFACGELEIHNSDINVNRDDASQSFTSALSDGSQLIFARLVSIGYLTRETYDILQMRLHLQDGDFKTYAEKNNLEAKQNALICLKEEAGWDIKKVGYNNMNVWGL